MERIKGRLAATFLLVAFVILAVGGWYYISQRQRMLDEALDRIEAVGRLKASQVSEWRAELVADARVLMDSHLFAEGVGRFLADGNAHDAESIRIRFQSMIDNYHYRAIQLVDLNNVTRIVAGTGIKKLDEEEHSVCAIAAATRKPAISSLHVSENEQIPHLNVALPVFSASRPSGPQVACVLIAVDPDEFLYPMIQAWPTPSETAETLLVRRDGDKVVFLNELRHRKQTALKMNMPLEMREVPAVRAALGETGRFIGTDYRGESVASALTQVEGSDWAIVSKVDLSEIYVEWQKQSVLIVVVVLLALVFAYALVRMSEERTAAENLREALDRERKLAEMDKRYAVTLMSIGDGVIVTDKEGRVELFNPVAEALTGWMTSEARGKPLSEVFNIVNEYTRAPAKNPVNEVLARGVIVGLANHTMLIAKDTSERPIADSAAPIRDGDGGLAGVVLVFRDQTAEHDYAKRISESEQRFRELFNSMMEGFALHVVITDADGEPADYRFLAINPAFERMTGIRAADVIGKRVLELIPDLEPQWIKRYGEVALTGEPVSFEDYNAALDKHFQVYAYRPRPGQFACVFRDVTEQALARKALESRVLALTRPAGDVGAVLFTDLFNLADLQSIQDKFADASGVASIITDPKGMPITKPSNFTRFCSEVVRGTPQGLLNCFRSSEVLGRHNPEGPTVKLCLSAGLWDAGAAILVGGHHVANWLVGQVRDETHTESEMRAYAREIGADEEEAAKAFNEIPLMGADRFRAVAEAMYSLARQLSTMAFVNLQQARFISDIKRGEEEKVELQEKLHQAHKLESVGRLAGGVAHDFNNMLGVILGHAELVLATLDEKSPYYEDLIEIQKAANRSADITRQLLAFARKQTISPRLLEPNRQIENSLKMLGRLLGEEIRIEWKPGEEVWKVRIDPTQLDQMLANLATNARDAMGGKGLITIETANAEIDDEYCKIHPDAMPGSYAVVTVSDTGKGIKQELLGKIFEPFFTTKEMGQGTGLGLSTVYGIARQNSGFVSVYSEPEHGATFRIYLPQQLSEEKGEAEKAVRKAVGGRETILVVEDEEGILLLAKRVLITLGYTVFAANSAEEALSIAESEEGKIDLLVTDVVMPTMNGKELAARAGASQPKMKVLYMSGYTAEIIAHHGVLETGVNFMPKPFSVNELGDRVRRVLDG